jgi:hypothetical protein
VPDEVDSRQQQRQADDPHRFTGRAVALSFFSGTGAAIVAGLLTWLLSGKTIAVEEKTVRGPPITQIKEVNVAKDGLPCAGSTFAGGPPYEPNDRLAEAYGPLRSGEPLRAALEDSDDTDFFAFCINESATIEVRVLETDCKDFDEEDYDSESCYGVDVELLDDRGKQLDLIEVDPDSTIGVLSKRLQPGRHYVRIEDGNGFRYELRAAGDVPLQERFFPRQVGKG